MTLSCRQRYSVFGYQLSAVSIYVGKLFLYDIVALSGLASFQPKSAWSSTDALFCKCGLTTETEIVWSLGFTGNSLFKASEFLLFYVVKCYVGLGVTIVDFGIKELS